MSKKVCAEGSGNTACSISLHLGEGCQREEDAPRPATALPLEAAGDSLLVFPLALNDFRQLSIPLKQPPWDDLPAEIKELERACIGGITFQTYAKCNDLQLVQE